MRLNRKKTKTKLEKLFICGNHNILIFNISPKKKKKNKITYGKYKINSNLKLQGWCTGIFYNIIILFSLKESVVECELLGMTTTIQVSKGWVSLTHIISERAYKSRTTYSFWQSTFIWFNHLVWRTQVPRGKPFKYFFLCPSQIKMVPAR